MVWVKCSFVCVSLRACSCKCAVCLESAVRMHYRDQRLLRECAPNLRGLAVEIVLCFPKCMLSLERRIAVDQSVSLARGFVPHLMVAFISPLQRIGRFWGSTAVCVCFVSKPNWTEITCNWQASMPLVNRDRWSKYISSSLVQCSHIFCHTFWCVSMP